MTEKTPINYVDDPKSRDHVSDAPVGYAIKCRETVALDYLILLEHTRPFESRTQAFRVLQAIESFGQCTHHHKIVEVWAVYAGRSAGKAKAS